MRPVFSMRNVGRRVGQGQKIIPKFAPFGAQDFRRCGAIAEIDRAGKAAHCAGRSTIPVAMAVHSDSPARSEASPAPSEATKTAIKAAILKYNLLLPAATRSSWYRSAAFMVPFAIVAFGLVWAFFPTSEGSSGSWKLYAAMLAILGFGGYWLWEFAWRPVADLRRTAREIIMPELFGFIENFGYRNGQKPEFLAHVPKAMQLAHTSAEFDDSICGTFDGGAFELAECKLWVGSGKNRSLEFGGIGFHFALEKPFAGTLVATRQLGLAEKIGYSFASGDGMTEITLANAEMANRFRVRSDQPQAAVDLLNAGLEDVLGFLLKKWDGGMPRLAICGAEGFLFLSSRRNFFEVPEGSIINYDAHVAPMLHELELLLSTARLVRNAMTGKPSQQRSRTLKRPG
jgi:hypothetical protein